MKPRPARGLKPGRPSNGTRKRSASVSRAVEDFATSAGIELPALIGFDHAMLGVAHQGGRYFLVYDHAMMLQDLVAQGLSKAEAVEYFDFNIAGADLGESTPAFLLKLGRGHAH